MREKFPIFIALLRLYFLGIFSFFALRLSVAIFYLDDFFDPRFWQNGFSLLRAFATGIRFDSIILGYTLTITCLLLFLCQWVNRPKRKIGIQLAYFYSLLCFFIYGALSILDFYFLAAFQERLNMPALRVLSHSVLSFKEIQQVPSSIFLLTIVPIILMIYFWNFFRREQRKFLFSLRKLGWPRRVIEFVICSLLVVLCARGKLSGGMPTGFSAAFFSRDDRLNQISLNPVFTFSKSIEFQFTKAHGYMDERKAIQITQKLFPGLRPWKHLPLTRILSPTTKTNNFTRPVVVLNFKPVSQLSPEDRGKIEFLNLPKVQKLLSSSIEFTQHHSYSVHPMTHFLALFFSHPSMKRHQNEFSFPFPKLGGLSNALFKKYEFNYFSSEKIKKQNWRDFLKFNHLEYNHIPLSGSESYWENIDLWMQNLSNYLKNEGQSEKSQFSYIDFPKFSPPSSQDIIGKSLDQYYFEQFLRSISLILTKFEEEGLFQDCLYVFTGQFGISEVVRSALDPNYFHVPLFIFDPLVDRQKKINKLSSHLDLIPSLASYLGVKYPDSGFGYDLFTKNQRSLAYYNHRSSIGILGDSFFIADGQELYKSELYLLSQDKLKFSPKKLVENARLLSNAQLQSAQWLRQSRTLNISFELTEKVSRSE